MSIFTKVFGTHSDHELKRIYPIVDKIEREGEKLYALRINGKLIEDGLTIDEVIRRINRNDMECLGERHCQTPETQMPRHSRR